MDSRSNAVAIPALAVPDCAAGRGSAPRGNVKFARATPDHAMHEMKVRVAKYFETRELSSKANAGMVVKTVLLLAITFVPYGLILTNRFSRWEMLLLAFAMGVGMAGIGFGIAHDALHGAYSASPRVNALLGMSLDVLGASSYMWKITHNIVHHTYTNIEGVDEDLAVSPLLRLSPNCERLWFHRFQHLYAFALYGFTTLFWVFVKDYQQLLKAELGPYRDKRHDRMQVGLLVGTKVGYYGYALVVPLLVLQIPWWQVLIGFFVMHFTAGAILGIVFQLAHVVESTDYPAPDIEGLIAQEWWLHENADHGEFRSEESPPVVVRRRTQLSGRAPSLPPGLQRPLPGDQQHRERGRRQVWPAVQRVSHAPCGDRVALPYAAAIRGEAAGGLARVALRRRALA